jgi:hypothetical protein
MAVRYFTRRTPITSETLGCNAAPLIPHDLVNRGSVKLFFKILLGRSNPLNQKVNPMADDPWREFCKFARDPWCNTTPDDFLAPWDVVTHPAKPKRTRKRKMTLDRAIKAACRAGVNVINATMAQDGSVKLQLGETSNDHDVNEWDSVQ